MLPGQKGRHNFTAGFQGDLQYTRNGFQRFGTSYYTFNSWADFVNGVNPRDFGITFSLLDGGKQAFPKFGFGQFSVYGQDEITVTKKLRVTAGLRVDLPQYLSVEEIKTHPIVDSLNFANGEKVNTGVLPKSRLLFSPRIGFNWDVKGDRSIQVRGGSGIFTGRVPTVWLVAQSGDAGLIQFTKTVSGTNVPGPFNPNPNAYIDASAKPGTSIPSSVSAIDRDFKFPQSWKSSLAVDAKLPGGVIGTLEGIYNKDINVALGRNPNLRTPSDLNVGGYPDRRPIYGATVPTRFIIHLMRMVFQQLMEQVPLIQLCYTIVLRVTTTLLLLNWKSNSLVVLPLQLHTYTVRLKTCLMVAEINS